MKETRTVPPAKPVRPGANRPPAANMGSLFDKSNLRLMLIGLAVMALGFILMAGGGSNDPNVWDPSKVNGTRRIVIAPIIILAGTVIEIFAIFRRPKNS